MRTNNEKRKKMKMSRTSLLITGAVAALMAAAGPSMAQHEGTPQRERTSPAEKTVPAEKMAPQNTPGMHNQGPGGHTGEAPQNRGRSETTGQAPREERQGRPGGQNAEQERGRSESPRREQEHPTGPTQREERRSGGSERDHTTGQAPRDDRANSPSRQNKAEQEREREDRERIDRSEGNRETTGQAGAGTRSRELTPENRTRIHEVVIRERNAPRIEKPDFDVSVGIRVPRSVRFVALPRTVLEIQPEWRGFEYFLIGDRMVIVDPRTMEIVAIVDA
jgi:hypothetical protein